MSLDVDTPAPPTLSDPQDTGDYDAVDEADDEVGDDGRREDLAEFLRNGAWERAFDEWTTNTMLTEDEFDLVLALDLLDEMDFYWNPAARDVGYRVPTVPPAAELPAPHDERYDDGDLDGVEEELDSLARTVSEVLEADYVDSDATEFGFYDDDTYDGEGGTDGDGLDDGRTGGGGFAGEGFEGGGFEADTDEEE